MLEGLRTHLSSLQGALRSGWQSLPNKTSLRLLHTRTVAAIPSRSDVSSAVTQAWSSLPTREALYTASSAYADGLKTSALARPYRAALITTGATVITASALYALRVGYHYATSAKVDPQPDTDPAAKPPVDLAAIGTAATAVEVSDPKDRAVPFVTAMERAGYTVVGGDSKCAVLDETARLGSGVKKRKITFTDLLAKPGIYVFMPSKIQDKRAAVLEVKEGAEAWTLCGANGALTEFATADDRIAQVKTALQTMLGSRVYLFTLQLEPKAVV